MAETFSPAMERFFEELRKTPRDWGFYDFSGVPRVRLHVDTKGEKHECPVCAVCNHIAGYTIETLCWGAGEVLFRTQLLKHEARLLECCGLTEVGK